MRRAASISLLGLVALCVAEVQAGQFKKAVYYPAGQRPYQVVTGQFTASGNLDLVFADWLSNQSCVLLGNGDGTFQKSQCFSVVEPVAVAAADFNEDGNLDLAVIEFNGTGDASLQFFLGDGEGGFHAGATYLAGIKASFLTVADFNGDGHMDVAVDARTDGTSGITVFFGTGKGTLGKPMRYRVSGGPAAIAAGDLNGDHHPDLAVTQFGTGSVAVLLNDGTGHFKKPVRYSWNGTPVDVKIADLRHDGRNDLVMADLAQGMVVLLNKGSGTFGKPTIYQPHFFNWQPPEACTVADFNLDGILDVACATQAEDSYLFYGKGDGTFGKGIPIANTIKNQGGFSIASGDFNHDGAPDLAIPIELDGKVAIMINTQ